MLSGFTEFEEIIFEIELGFDGIQFISINSDFFFGSIILVELAFLVGMIFFTLIDTPGMENAMVPNTRTDTKSNKRNMLEI